MRVVVDVLGPLERYVRGGGRKVQVEVPEGTTVRDLLVQMGIDINEPWNASLNGTLADSSSVVTEGSVLIVFPPIAGGGLGG